MNFYVAAPWDHRGWAKYCAGQIMAAGHHITRHWWDAEAGDEEEEKLGDLALLDLMGVLQCDVLVVLNTQKSEGKAVETGVALAIHYVTNFAPPKIYVLGPKSNIFHNMRQVRRNCDTIEEVLEDLQKGDR